MNSSHICARMLSAHLMHAHSSGSPRMPSRTSSPAALDQSWIEKSGNLRQCVTRTCSDHRLHWAGWHWAWPSPRACSVRMLHRAQPTELSRSLCSLQEAGGIVIRTPSTLPAPRIPLAAQSNYTRRLRLSVNPFPDAIEVPWLQGLAPLPASHGPHSPAWTNSFALCATMKDENITDVAEWITYYRWLGVEHIFLTDNLSDDGDQLLAQLKELFPPEFLTLRTEGYERAQLKTYAWCVEEHRHRFNWMAFLDMDEFLVVQNGTKIKDFMDAYKHEAGLSVHWVWVGPNGRTARPASGGVLPYYTLCAASADKHVKTIANTFYLSGLDVHPHNFRFRDGRQSVDEDFAEVPVMWKGNLKFKTKHSGTDGACSRMRRPRNPNHGKLHQHCFQSSGSLIEPARAARVALYHYATKSLQDFTDKMSRGSGMSAAVKDMDYFAEIARCDAARCLRLLTGACSRLVPGVFARRIACPGSLHV
eukprot:jgi/Ulvmu1/8933/UM005_0024.1